MRKKTLETAVLILAAGRNDVWREVYPGAPLKQLYVLNPPGETIIARQIRQCENRGIEAIVVSHEPEIIKESKGRYYEPTMREGTIQTLLSTISFWKERTIVLHGDVIFGKKGMNQVFAWHEPYGSFGNHFETFAISFRKSYWLKMVKLIMRTMELSHSALERGIGHMWNVFCKDDNRGPKTMDRSEFILIKDYTSDIDSPGYWESFSIGVLGKGRLDDLPRGY